MLCRKPFALGGALFPCGQCIPCRIYRRRVWTHRIMLESMSHADNAFVTLTYDAEHLPADDRGNVTLVPEDLVKWFKRLRGRTAPRKIRYYAIGEYGSLTKRPHYHAVLFGYPRCRHGSSRYSMGLEHCCDVCDEVRSTWGLGLVHSGALSVQSAAYVAGYVLGKRCWDDKTLNGACPEFARMSLKPGIGCGYIPRVAEGIGHLPIGRFGGDVPAALRHGGKVFPLGRYLRQQLRVVCGRSPETPKEVIDAIKAELQGVREFAFDTSQSFASVASMIDDGRYAQLIGREAIYRGRNKV